MNATDARRRVTIATVWWVVTMLAAASCSPSDDAGTNSAAGSGGKGSGGAPASASGGAPAGTNGGASGTSGGAATTSGGASGTSDTAGAGGAPAMGSGGERATGSGGDVATGGGGSSPVDAGTAGGEAVDAGQADSRPVPSNEGGRSDPSPGNYQPCPPKGTVCVIMPLGDSITEGAKSSGGGYRPPLFRLALQDKKSITFVGDAPANGPTSVDNVTFPRANEGWSGYTIDQISGLVVSTMNKNKPHIITLQIGTNDVNRGRGSGAPTRLGDLIDKIVATNPNVLLVVAQITPTKTAATNADIKTYNDALPAVIKTRADAGKHVLMVDMFDAFTKDANYMTTLMGDNLHPKDAGYKVMADVWYSPLKSVLP